MKVERIAIVGGGSSGWMTAATLVKKHPEIAVSLVESPATPTIGVGESTLIGFNDFLKYLDWYPYRDAQWMPHCNATYKNSIKFTNWNGDGAAYHYPFGKLDLNHTHYGIFDWFLKKALYPDTPVAEFARCYHTTIEMIDANKFTGNERGEIPNFDQVRDTAYQLDARRFGEYLRDAVCLPSGLEHVVDHVREVALDERGYISGIHTESGKTIVADLYVDCTGFRSMLLESRMGAAFESFGAKLLNDRALAVHIPYADKHAEMESFTNCTAHRNGWVWSIPLYHRIGAGYVYSSAFIDDDAAEQEFVDYIAERYGAKRAEGLSFNRIRIKHGVHDRGWIRNCVAIGLSFGFVEPLESTGLASTHELIKYLSDLLYKGFYNKYDIDTYNRLAYELIVGYHNFVACHYATANRDDTPYWRYNQEEIDWFDIHEQRFVEQSITRYAEHYFNTARSSESHFRLLKNIAPGVYYINTGSNFLPLHHVDQFLRNLATLRDPHEEFLSLKAAIDQTARYWTEKHAYLSKIVAALPTHYQWLKDHIYGGAE